MTVKNLGLVKAIQAGTTPPANTQILWYDTNMGVNIHKYYDVVSGLWTPLPATAGVDFTKFDTWRTGVRQVNVVDPSSIIGLQPGDRFIVGDGAVGDFAGEDRNIANRVGTSWEFETPEDNWAVLVTEDRGKVYVFEDLVWVERFIDGAGGGSGEIYAVSVGDASIPEQLVEGVAVGPQIDRRIEEINGKQYLVIGDPYVAPIFQSFSIAGQSTVIEAGDSIAGGVRTFNWSVNDPGGNLTPNDITIRDVDAAVDLATGLSNDGTEDINIGAAVPLVANQTQTYRISSGQDIGGDITRDYTVIAYWAIYSGNNALSSVTEADIEALSNKSLQAGFAATYALNAGGYKWICYPTTMGTATSFIDTSNNLPVAMEPFGGTGFQLVSVTNVFGETVDYKCHRTLNQLGSSINIAVS